MGLDGGRVLVNVELGAKSGDVLILHHVESYVGIIQTDLHNSISALLEVELRLITDVSLLPWPPR